MHGIEAWQTHELQQQEKAEWLGEGWGGWSGWAASMVMMRSTAPDQFEDNLKQPQGQGRVEECFKRASPSHFRSVQ
jgi:hypothetical protein